MASKMSNTSRSHACSDTDRTELCSNYYLQPISNSSSSLTRDRQQPNASNKVDLTVEGEVIFTAVEGHVDVDEVKNDASVSLPNDFPSSRRYSLRDWAVPVPGSLDQHSLIYDTCRGCRRGTLVFKCAGRARAISARRTERTHGSLLVERPVQYLLFPRNYRASSKLRTHVYY